MRAVLLGWFTSCVVAASAGAADPGTMLEQIRRERLPYIAQYGWPYDYATGDEPADALFKELTRFGSTGIQNSESPPFDGTRRFLEEGMHGIMPQMYLPFPDPQLFRDGTPFGGRWGCLASERNIRAGAPGFSRTEKWMIHGSPRLLMGRCAS